MPVRFENDDAVIVHGSMKKRSISISGIRFSAAVVNKQHFSKEEAID